MKRHYNTLFLWLVVIVLASPDSLHAVRYEHTGGSITSDYGTVDAGITQAIYDTDARLISLTDTNLTTHEFSFPIALPTSLTDYPDYTYIHIPNGQTATTIQSTYDSLTQETTFTVGTASFLKTNANTIRHTNPTFGQTHQITQHTSDLVSYSGIRYTYDAQSDGWLHRVSGNDSFSLNAPACTLTVTDPLTFQLTCADSTFDIELSSIGNMLTLRDEFGYTVRYLPADDIFYTYDEVGDIYAKFYPVWSETNNTLYWIRENKAVSDLGWDSTQVFDVGGSKTALMQAVDDNGVLKWQQLNQDLTPHATSPLVTHSPTDKRIPPALVTHPAIVAMMRSLVGKAHNDLESIINHSESLLSTANTDIAALGVNTTPAVTDLNTALVHYVMFNTTAPADLNNLATTLRQGYSYIGEPNTPYFISNDTLQPLLDMAQTERITTFANTKSTIDTTYQSALTTFNTNLNNALTAASTVGEYKLVLDQAKLITQTPLNTTGASLDAGTLLSTIATTEDTVYTTFLAHLDTVTTDAYNNLSPFNSEIDDLQTATLLGNWSTIDGTAVAQLQANITNFETQLSAATSVSSNDFPQEHQTAATNALADAANIYSSYVSTYQFSFNLNTEIGKINDNALTVITDKQTALDSRNTEITNLKNAGASDPTNAADTDTLTSYKTTLTGYQTDTNDSIKTPLLATPVMPDTQFETDKTTLLASIDTTLEEMTSLLSGIDTAINDYTTTNTQLTGYETTFAPEKTYFDNLKAQSDSDAAAFLASFSTLDSLNTTCSDIATKHATVDMVYTNATNTTIPTGTYYAPLEMKKTTLITEAGALRGASGIAATLYQSLSSEMITRGTASLTTHTNLFSTMENDSTTSFTNYKNQLTVAKDDISTHLMPFFGSINLDQTLATSSLTTSLNTLSLDLAAAETRASTLNADMVDYENLDSLLASLETTVTNSQDTLTTLQNTDLATLTTYDELKAEADKAVLHNTAITGVKSDVSALAIPDHEAKLYFTPLATRKSTALTTSDAIIGSSGQAGTTYAYFTNEILSRGNATLNPHRTKLTTIENDNTTPLSDYKTDVTTAISDIDTLKTFFTNMSIDQNVGTSTLTDTLTTLTTNITDAETRAAILNTDIANYENLDSLLTALEATVSGSHDTLTTLQNTDLATLTTYDELKAEADKAVLHNTAITSVKSDVAALAIPDHTTKVYFTPLANRKSSALTSSDAIIGSSGQAGTTYAYFTNEILSRGSTQLTAQTTDLTTLETDDTLTLADYETTLTSVTSNLQTLETFFTPYTLDNTLLTSTMSNTLTNLNTTLNSAKSRATALAITDNMRIDAKFHEEIFPALKNTPTAADLENLSTAITTTLSSLTTVEQARINDSNALKNALDEAHTTYAVHQAFSDYLTTGLQPWWNDTTLFFTLDETTPTFHGPSLYEELYTKASAVLSQPAIDTLQALTFTTPLYTSDYDASSLIQTLQTLKKEAQQAAWQAQYVQQVMNVMALNLIHVEQGSYDAQQREELSSYADPSSYQPGTLEHAYAQLGKTTRQLLEDLLNEATIDNVLDGTLFIPTFYNVFFFNQEYARSSLESIVSASYSTQAEQIIALQNFIKEQITTLQADMLSIDYNIDNDTEYVSAPASTPSRLRNNALAQRILATVSLATNLTTAIASPYLILDEYVDYITAQRDTLKNTILPVLYSRYVESMTTTEYNPIVSMLTTPPTSLIQFAQQIGILQQQLRAAHTQLTTITTAVTPLIDAQHITTHQQAITNIIQLADALQNYLEPFKTNNLISLSQKYANAAQNPTALKGEAETALTALETYTTTVHAALTTDSSNTGLAHLKTWYGIMNPYLTGLTLHADYLLTITTLQAAQTERAPLVIAVTQKAEELDAILETQGTSSDAYELVYNEYQLLLADLENKTSVYETAVASVQEFEETIVANQVNTIGQAISAEEKNERISASLILLNSALYIDLISAHDRSTAHAQLTTTITIDELAATLHALHDSFKIKYKTPAIGAQITANPHTAQAPKQKPTKQETDITFASPQPDSSEPTSNKNQISVTVRSEVPATQAPVVEEARARLAPNYTTSETEPQVIATAVIQAPSESEGATFVVNEIEADPEATLSVDPERVRNIPVDLFLEEGTHIKVGSSYLSENTEYSLSLLGKNATIVADGNCTITLNTDITIIGNTPFLPTEQFASIKKGHIKIRSDQPRVIRLEKGVTLDLSAFFNGIHQTTIELENIILHMEADTHIRFPFVSESEQAYAPILQLSGNSSIQTDQESDVHTIKGVGTLCLKNNSEWNIYRGSTFHICSDYDNPLTTVTLALYDNACFSLGKSSISGGSLMIGNTYKGGEAPGSDYFPNTSDNSDSTFIPHPTQVNATISIHSTTAQFILGRQSFLGFGAGKTTSSLLTAPGDTKTPWSIYALHDVGSITLDMIGGHFIHNQLLPLTHSDASLWAIGSHDTAGHFSLQMNTEYESVIQGGGTLLFVGSDAHFDTPYQVVANNTIQHTPRNTPTGAQTILASRRSHGENQGNNLPATTYFNFLSIPSLLENQPWDMPVWAPRGINQTSYDALITGYIVQGILYRHPLAHLLTTVNLSSQQALTTLDWSYSVPLQWVPIGIPS